MEQNTAPTNKELTDTLIALIFRANTTIDRIDITLEFLASKLDDDEKRQFNNQIQGLVSKLNRINDEL